MEITLYNKLLSDMERHFYHNGKTVKRNFWSLLKCLSFNTRFLPVVIYRLSFQAQEMNFYITAKLLTLFNFVIFGTEISPKCAIGRSLCFPHTLGSVIGAARIGKTALIYHGVTIGANTMDYGYTMDKRPLVGDNVTLGSGAKILGGITIGNNVVVGANAVVVNSIPDNVVVGGVPARIIRHIANVDLNMETERLSCRIDILMATFNGAPYIKKQIASIQAQDYPHWRLIIRDDGSTDETLQIVAEIAAADERIHLLTDSHGNVGASANFGLLLEYAKSESARYVALADQDDFWEKWKLKRQLKVMTEAESHNGAEPVLVYSDLMVVDGDLRYISSSMMSYQMMRHEAVNPLEVLLVQNYVTGCTVFFNKSLLDVSVPLPPTALMHDWWLAILTGACGKLCYIDEPLVYYRQHAHNEVGAKSFLELMSPRKTSWRKMLEFWNEGNKRFPKGIVQARELYKRIDERNLSVSPGTREFIRNYLDIWARKGFPVTRMCKLMRLGIRRQSFFTQILLIIRCLMVKSRPK